MAAFTGPGGSECNLAPSTATFSLLSDSGLLGNYAVCLCCQVVQSLNHDLKIKSLIMSSNKSFSEAFVQVHRLFIQISGTQGTSRK